jgi:hypothetical protein
MRRGIQVILVISMLCGLGGCFGPDYGPTYGYPMTGYAPYSYGLPVYARGYTPSFTVHHPWEEHHAHGHNVTFFHPPPGPQLGHVGGGHTAQGHRDDRR